VKSKVIYVDNVAENKRLQGTIKHKLSMFILIVSFLLFSLSEALIAYNIELAQLSEYTNSTISAFLVELIVIALFNFLIFYLAFMLYRFIAGLNIFSYVIPRLAYIDDLKYAMVARNIISGCIRLLLLVFAPFAYFYWAILDLLVMFICFVVAVKRVINNYASLAVSAPTFNAFCVPYLICVGIYVAIQILEFIL